jgi:hypothetical protein
MKIIIAGGRDYKLNQDDFQRLENIENISELVSGGAAGVDSDAERWALERNIPIKQFKPNWKQFGRAAGPKRNKEMAKYADAVALFQGGKGTQSMHAEASREGIVIYDFRNA